MSAFSPPAILVSLHSRVKMGTFVLLEKTFELFAVRIILQYIIVATLLVPSCYGNHNINPDESSEQLHSRHLRLEIVTSTVKLILLLTKK